MISTWLVRQGWIPAWAALLDEPGGGRRDPGRLAGGRDLRVGAPDPAHNGRSVTSGAARARLRPDVVASLDKTPYAVLTGHPYAIDKGPVVEYLCGHSTASSLRGGDEVPSSEVGLQKARCAVSPRCLGRLKMVQAYLPPGRQARTSRQRRRAQLVRPVA